jgi:hypothetical protein
MRLPLIKYGNIALTIIRIHRALSPLLFCNFRSSVCVTHQCHIFCCSTRFYPWPVSHGAEWLILGYALLCRINLHTVFRYSYVCYFLVVWPLVSLGESDWSIAFLGLIHIPFFGMVLILEKKQRHIFWFLSFSSRAARKPRDRGKKDRRHRELSCFNKTRTIPKTGMWINPRKAMDQSLSPKLTRGHTTRK